MNIRKEKSRIRKTETDKGRKNTKMKSELHKQIDWQEAAHRDTQKTEKQTHTDTYTQADAHTSIQIDWQRQRQRQRQRQKTKHRQTQRYIGKCTYKDSNRQTHK